MKPEGIYSNNQTRIKALKVGDRVRVRNLESQHEATFVVSERKFLGLFPMKVLVEATLAPTDDWFFLHQLYARDISWRYLPEAEVGWKPIREGWEEVIAQARDQMLQSSQLPEEPLKDPTLGAPWMGDALEKFSSDRGAAWEISYPDAEDPFGPLREAINAIPNTILRTELLVELKTLERRWAEEKPKQEEQANDD